MRLKRPIRTRFRYGCPTRVNLATQRKLAGSFFKRHAVTPTSEAPTDCRHTVSGTISLPARGTFHLSLTLYGAAFQRTSTSHALSYCATYRQIDPRGPTTPHTQPLPGITCAWFSLIRFRSPLLSESLLFSLPSGTEMFHFPEFPPHTLYIQARVTGHDSSWVSPFGHPRITAWLPTPQGLSQATTSFIGS